MSEAWKMRPYLGVSCFVLIARNNAFSAPKIWRNKKKLKNK